MSDKHKVTKAPEQEHAIENTERRIFSHRGARTVAQRTYWALTEYGRFEMHEGVGLEPEVVLSLLARGYFWERKEGETTIECDDETDDRETTRDDVVLFEGRALVGIILNQTRHPAWFDGKALALSVTTTGGSVEITEVQPDPHPDLDGFPVRKPMLSR